MSWLLNVFRFTTATTTTYLSIPGVGIIAVSGTTISVPGSGLVSA